MFLTWKKPALDHAPMIWHADCSSIVLMMALKTHLVRSGLSQAQIAKLFGVTQPRVSDLLRGKINLFGLDALVNMAVAAGLRVRMSVRKAA